MLSDLHIQSFRKAYMNERHIPSELVEQIARRAGLRYEPSMQDWDVQMADPARCRDLITLYDLSSDAIERIALMQIMVASFEEYLDQHEPDLEVEQMLRERLVNEWTLHQSTIEYWANIALPENDSFNVTPLMRGLIRSH